MLFLLLLFIHIIYTIDCPVSKTPPEGQQPIQAFVLYSKAQMFLTIVAYKKCKKS